VPRQQIVRLSKLELRVMESLWNLGRGSVREIQEGLPGKKSPAYTTIQTIVYRLERKGAVRRVKKIGNAHIFEPIITRETAHGTLIGDFLDLLGGSSRPLMAHLVETRKLTREDLKALEAALADADNQASPDRPRRKQ
jgi:BlaI family transcriptional regulator, penicillinase repressor